MPNNPKINIYTLIAALRKRTGRTYEQARDMMATELDLIEFDRSTFDNKFRRQGRSTKYHLDEVVAIIHAYYLDLPEAKRCTAYEALQIFDLTGMRIDDHHHLKAIFGDAHYGTAWSTYLREHDLTVLPEPEVTKQPFDLDHAATGHVFISYSNQNANSAQQLRRLIEASGYSVWQDITAIPGGHEWLHEIEQGINGSCALVVITSAHLATSYWVWEEILHAQRRHKQIIPLVIDGAPLPFGLQQMHSIDAYTDFDRGVRQLFETLGPCLDNGVTTTDLSHRELEIDYLDRVLLEYGAWKTAYTPMAGTALRTAMSGNRVEIKTVNVPLQMMTDFDQHLDEKFNTPQVIDYQDDILRAMNDFRQFVLLGEPGGGKTTTLWYLAASFAEMSKEDETQPLPILLKLGEIEEHQSLREKIESQLGNLAPWFDDLMQSARVALLIDGLNEIPEKARLPRLNELRSLVKASIAKNILLVVSCRTLDYTSDFELNLAGQVAIKPLDPLRVRQIIDNYLEEKQDKLFWALAGGSARYWWDRFVKDFGEYPEIFWLQSQLPDKQTWGFGKEKNQYFYWEQWLKVREHPQRMFQLAANPFMLFMLMRVFARQHQIPANRSKLLETFIDFLLTRREGLSSAVASGLENKLSSLAYTIQQSYNADRISVEEAHHQLGGAESFRSAQMASILVSDGKSVQFAHQLIQEYFAARQLDHQVRTGIPASHYWPQESWWQKNEWDESAILLAGIYDTDTTPIITWLQDASPEVAARCIVESGGLTSDTLVNSLAANWVKRLTESPIAARAAIGRALGIADNDPRAGVGLTSEGLPDIAWVAIPGGEFIYGDNEKQHTDTFAISRYPITHSQFQAFLSAADGFHNPIWWQDLARQEQSPGNHSFPYANHPCERVSWYDAIAFCRWFSHRSGYVVNLPAEYQWEKAARGSDGYLYPYGNTFDPARGNVDLTGLGRTSAVGIFLEGASPYGVLDMSGNVFEWCLNLAESPDKIDMNSTGRRSLRGGSWAHSQDYARANYRYSNRSELRRNRVGFRIVRDR